MKITARSPKARNPLVVPSLMRRAGSHQATGGARRQRANRAVQRELLQFVPDKHSP